MQNEKLKEFFKTHPEEKEAHLANGVLFRSKKHAQAYSEKVETFKREDALKAESEKLNDEDEKLNDKGKEAEGKEPKGKEPKAEK